MVVSDSI